MKLEEINNPNFVDVRLELLGAKKLTDEERAEFVEKKLQYATESASVIKEIKTYEEKISEFKAQLEKNRPSIPNAKYIHSGNIGCRLKSVLRLGRDTTSDGVYYCFFCDKTFQVDSMDGISDGTKELSDLTP